jgi:hypothetical protein
MRVGVAGGWLVGGVFFDFAEFYFNSLLFSQDEEKHSGQQNQNYYHRNH